MGQEHIAVISCVPGSGHLLLAPHHVLEGNAAVNRRDPAPCQAHQPATAAKSGSVGLSIQIQKIDERRSTSVSRLLRKSSLIRIAAAARR